MQIAVYQIEDEKDANRVMFLGYDFTLRRAGRIDPKIYRRVFSGKVECNTLNGVFDLFNRGKLPDDYHGHSLSVSDIVEVCGERKEGYPAPGFYFCDNIGWRSLPNFGSTKTTPLQSN